MIKTKARLGHLLGLFTGIVWGVTFTSSKILLQSFSSIELLFYRFLIAFFALCILYPKPFKWQGWDKELRFIIAGATGVTFYQYMENAALNNTYASNVSVIVAIAPLLTALFVWIATKGKEKLKSNFVLGFLVAIAGIAFIAFNGSRLQLSPLGDFFAVCCAIIWGLYSVNGNMVASYKFNVLATTRRAFLYGILFLIPLMIKDGFTFGVERFANPVNLLNMLFLGVVASGLCFVTWNYAISVLGSVKTTVYIYVSPVVTVVVSALVLHEKVTPLLITGTVLTLAGLVISNMNKKKMSD
ncbi:MAG: DMT family transporter [Pseudobutyrivibrio sp.]|nr:DMT family transporter [Pseudobutyrivibrio sp.]